MIWASVPVSVTVSVPLWSIAAPPVAASVRMPYCSDSVVVITPAPESSATDSPVIAAGTLASNSRVPGTLLTGASFTPGAVSTGMTVMANVRSVTWPSGPSRSVNVKASLVVSLPSCR